ncbi:hypothetical protein BDY19DRAFT_935661 [Irpex rosettiformis]|uniref:Uncharacterized protein n=1 Tax=Irpex rosettiformis TaxID=378272 RepID=A0ACB8U8G5_9APHY|nr:hypothetical protein BDY19DRAFT_935661 [Irpex rosettiformis]
MSSELLKLYHTGDYDAIARVKMEEQKTIKTTADKIASTNQAFEQVTLKNGEKIHMARTDEATTYCRVLPGSISKLGNGKAECVAHITSISHTTNTGTVTTIPLKNLDSKLLDLGETSVTASLSSWFTDILKRGFNGAMEGLVDLLHSALAAWDLVSSSAKLRLVEAGVVLVGSAIGGVLGGPVGALIGGAVAYGVFQLVLYALTKYTLIGSVYNFDPDHDWSIDDNFYGRNEHKVQGPSPGPISRCHPAGKYVIPGMNIASDVGSAAVYFKTFIFENDYSIAGFTVAGLVRRNDTTRGESPVGVNFAYRIEKMADNSMALNVNTGHSAGSYFVNDLDGGSHTTKTKRLERDGDVRAIITSPELSSTPNDIYSCVVSIGTPPKDWHAVGQ